MRGAARTSRERFRVWIAGYEEWRPTVWHDVPPQAEILTPAHRGALTREQAVLFVRAFNQSMLAQPKNAWAIAVPVVPCWSGDLRSGQVITGDCVRGLAE